MKIEQDFEGEIYEIDVKMEDKENLRHIAHYPIKSGPRTYKSVNVFDVIASESGKKLVYFWKSRLDKTTGKLLVEEETEFRCRPEELERLFALLDNLEEVVGLERGEHIILQKDAPSTQAAIAAIESTRNAEADEIEELIIKLIESAGEVGSKIENVDLIVESLSEEMLGVENLISYAKTQRVVDKFRELVSQEENEQKYQDFLEEYPWLFGNRYVRNSDIRTLTRDEQVDFCLESVNGYFDVFEIKRPDHNVLNYDNSHETYYPSSELSKAVSQVQHYLKEIEHSYHEILVKDELNVLKPRGNIVIGSGLDTEELEGLRVFNSYLNRIEILTFQQLVKMGERLLEVHNGNISTLVSS